MHAWHDTATEERHGRLGFRSHPWTVADHNFAHRYIDFKKRPDLIEATCLDFTPWRDRLEVRAFYELLRWLNGPEGVFETNDCALHGPSPNTQRGPTHVHSKQLVLSGRLMLFLRDQTLNAQDAWSVTLLQSFEHYLKQYDQAPGTVVIGLSRSPTRFIDLPDQPLGHELDVHWWAYGDDETEIWSGFESVVTAVRWTCGFVAEDLAQTRLQQPPVSA